MLPTVGNMLLMQLMAYLKDQKLSVPDFARSIEEPIGTIHKIAYRQRQPSLTLAVKISEATKGAVSPTDMALSEQERSSQAAA